jgi:hypothetical protein
MSDDKPKYPKLKPYHLCDCDNKAASWFNGPECDRCRRIREMMQAHEGSNQFVEANKVRMFKGLPRIVT